MAENQIRFDDGAAYERMMGNWSRLAGEIFLDWLAPLSGLRWIDIGCIKPVFGERKRHSVTLAKLRHARCGSCARKSELSLGWINSLNLRCRAPLDEQLREGAVAAADVDPS